MPFVNILYNFLLIFLTPLALCRLLFKSRRNVEYRRNINERFGYNLPAYNHPEPIWIHTVSVGEFLTARPLLIELLNRNPALYLWITCTTPTARVQIAQFQDQYPNRIQYSYIPYDIGCNNLRALNHIRPAAIILMETEIWPNLIHQAVIRNIPVLLINARLSARSLRRYLRFARCLIQPALQYLHINAQTGFDARRFRILGAPKSNITITPNLKYQKPINQTAPSDILALKSQAYTWIAASTHPGEEQIILAAHKILQQFLPDARLIIAPRHPERRNEIITLIKKAGYIPCLRSYQQTPQTSADVFIVDTLGELNHFYQITNTAFIGGSLIPHGGHNPIEALHNGNAVIFGQSMYNFQAISDELSVYPFIRPLTDNRAETLSNALLELEHPACRTTIVSYTTSHANVAAKHAAFIIKFTNLLKDKK